MQHSLNIIMTHEHPNEEILHRNAAIRSKVIEQYGMNSWRDDKSIQIWRTNILWRTIQYKFRNFCFYFLHHFNDFAMILQPQLQVYHMSFKCLVYLILIKYLCFISGLSCSLLYGLMFVIISNCGQISS